MPRWSELVLANEQPSQMVACIRRCYEGERMPLVALDAIAHLEHAEYILERLIDRHTMEEEIQEVARSEG